MKRIKNLIRFSNELIDKSQSYFNPFDAEEKFGALVLATILFAIAFGLGFVANCIDIFWLQILITIIAYFVGLGFAMGLMLSISGWLCFFTFFGSLVCFLIFEDILIPKDMTITFHYFNVPLIIINIIIIIIWTIILIIKKHHEQRIERLLSFFRHKKKHENINNSDFTKLEEKPYPKAEIWKSYPNSIFFIQPPPEIGEIVHSYTTLFKNGLYQSKNKRKIKIILFTLIGLIIGLIIPENVDATSTFARIIWLSIGLFVGFSIGFTKYYLKYEFWNECSYVGKNGVAFFEIKNNPNNLIKSDIIQFSQIMELQTEVVPKYSNKTVRGNNFIVSSMSEGKYVVGCNYCYSWISKNNKVKYKYEIFHNSTDFPTQIEFGNVHKIMWLQSSSIAWDNYKKSREI